MRSAENVTERVGCADRRGQIAKLGLAGGRAWACPHPQVDKPHSALFCGYSPLQKVDELFQKFHSQLILICGAFERIFRQRFKARRRVNYAEDVKLIMPFLLLTAARVAGRI